MRTPSLIAVLLLAGTALPAAAEKTPGSQVSYSADAIIETAEGAARSRINAAPGKERREDITDGGETMISIRRDDLGKLWMLMPSERMYMEIDTKKAGKKAAKGRTPSPEEFDVEMTEVGKEVVNGLQTTKSKVVMTDPDGSKMGGYWWMTPEGILVKMDVIAVEKGEKTRMKRELSNVVIAPQDPALFEIPPGYASMMQGIGAGMLGGIPGLGGSDAEDGEGSGPKEDTPAEPKKKKGFGLGTLRDVLDKVP